MKYRALLSATAIISASFSPITLISAADAATYAASANPPSSADMQAVCDALDSDGAGTDYQVILTEGTPALGSPTNDLSTITDDESTRVADHSSASSPERNRSTALPAATAATSTCSRRSATPASPTPAAWSTRMSTGPRLTRTTSPARCSIMKLSTLRQSILRQCLLRAATQIRGMIAA